LNDSTPLPKDQHVVPVTATPASAINGGREVSSRILYVGSLPKTVSDEVLKELFQSAGAVVTVKILNDKNRAGFNYAFIEFESSQDAETALHSFNGKAIDNSEMKINWAYQSSTINSTQNPDEMVFNIFVGDLSPEVDDEALFTAFNRFPSLKQAHVMWDMQTSRSRGYGFVTFTVQQDAELALQTMNGEWISGRAIRCNWASHRQPSGPNNMNQLGPQRRRNNNYRGNPINNRQQMVYVNGGTPEMQSNGTILQHPQQNNIPVMTPQSYDIVMRQTPTWQTTVYLGNIAHFTQQAELIPLLQNFGYIVSFKFHPERGCAFVKYDSHERAALAIVQLAGFNVNGRPLKCGWGKDRPPMNTRFQNFRPQQMYGQ
jgi:nucleolysin TIA-1/TIAR